MSQSQELAFSKPQPYHFAVLGDRTRFGFGTTASEVGSLATCVQMHGRVKIHSYFETPQPSSYIGTVICLSYNVKSKVLGMSLSYMLIGHKVDSFITLVKTNSGVYGIIGKNIEVTLCLYSRQIGHRLAVIKPDWHFHQQETFHRDLTRKVAIAHKSQASRH